MASDIVVVVVDLTGRGYYKRISLQLGLGDRLVQNPDEAQEPIVAARILAIYLMNKQILLRDALAQGDLPRARRIMTGGTGGLSRFSEAYQAAIATLQ